MFILAGSDQIFQFECRRAQSFPESLQHIQKMALPMAKEQKKKDDFFKTMISFDQKDSKVRYWKKGNDNRDNDYYDLGFSDQHRCQP